MYADTRKPLVVAGSINADLVAKVARLPAPGETMESQGFDVFPGGKVKWVAGPNTPHRMHPKPAPCEGDCQPKLQITISLQGANQAAAAARLGYNTFLIGQASTAS